MQNPDPRPLPNGWTQHYDTSRNSWYYIQTNVTPPRASHHHPADLRPDDLQTGPSRGFVTPPPPPPLYPGIPTSLSGQSNGGYGLSPAQRLYASSAKIESMPPLISAGTRDLRNLDVPQAPPSRTSMSGTPTPPASISPSAGFRSPPLQNISRENDATHVPTNFADRRTNQSNESGSSVADTPSSEIAPPSYALMPTDDEFSIPDETNDSQEASTVQPPPFDAAQSYEVPPPSLPTDNHHRSTNNGFHNRNLANDSPASQPHFHRAQSYQVPPLPPLSGDRTTSYPASSSAHSSSSTGPRSTPQVSRFAQPPRHPESTLHHQTTVSQPPPFQSVPATGNQQTAQPQTRGGSAVGKSILSDKVVNALLNIFSGSNSGVNQSTLHAVLQDQPGADYQSIMNALTLKQHQANMLRLQGSQQTPPIDYQGLINELRRAQMVTSPQQGSAQQVAAHLAQQHSTQQASNQQAFARLAQQTSAYQAYTQQAFAHLAQQASGPSATQQNFAHLAQQAQQPAPQQPFGQQPFVQPPFVQQPFAQQPFAQQTAAQQTAAQQPFAQQPFAQQPFAQQTAAQQTATQQTAAQQTAALEEQMAALQAYERLAARGRQNALDLLDDGRWTYVRKSSNPSNRILDLI